MEIRQVAISDAQVMSRYYRENINHFERWEPKRAHSFHSEDEWRARLKGCVRDQELGAAAFFVAIDNGKVIGHCNLTQIVRGPFMACYMGYGVAASHEGLGVAYKLCEQAIAFAFESLGLHRIMANYLPHNNRSARLLSRLGFIREGVAKDYLKIAGRWQDHVLTSLTNKSSR